MSSRALTPVRVQEHAPGRSLFAVLICVLGSAEVICGLSGAHRCVQRAGLWPKHCHGWERGQEAALLLPAG